MNSVVHLAVLLIVIVLALVEAIPGSHGEDAHSQEGECRKKCKHGRICTRTYSGYECECPPNTTGPRCEQVIDNCASGPCHQGECVNAPGLYSCICETGYTGQNCETICSGSWRQIFMLLPPYENVLETEDPSTIQLCMQNCVTNASCAGILFTEVFGNTCYSLNSTQPRLANGVHSAYIFLELVDSCPDVSSDACASSPCFNLGTCNNTVDGFECTCPTGYTGTVCDQFAPDPCSSDPNPCQNHGTCWPRPFNMFECICALGYTGLLCQELIDNCAPNPCLHGQCVNVVGSYSCSCAAGYTGQNCTEPDCASGPCGVNGLCEEFESSFKCDCNYPYTGLYCDELIPT